ncbi:MAG: hypothetical protein MZV70_44040 [Desulfobacterales bacterium]|nr:hypothetical protein [Desulfobacterales bacterium]
MPTNDGGSPAAGVPAAHAKKLALHVQSPGYGFPSSVKERWRVAPGWFERDNCLIVPDIHGHLMRKFRARFLLIAD